MKKYSIILISILFSFCEKKPPEPSELYEIYRSSVALIKTSYYFETELSEKIKISYKIGKDGLEFFENENQANSNPSTAFGTGFFISDIGELATNKHVVSPKVDGRLNEEAIKGFINKIKLSLFERIKEKQESKDKLNLIWRNYFDDLTIDRKIEIRNSLEELSDDIIELRKLFDDIPKIDFSKSKTSVRIVSLGVAFDDTHVNSEKDFKECILVKEAESDDVDLAIIQLKSKITPASVKNIFLLNNSNTSSFKLNDKVFMIGFNHGMSLASTQNGIKSQFTEGSITQDPDKNKVLYSIPTLPGSSGSPIIDRWGNLVAVNFAKTSDFQGFSFGVPAEQLVALHDNNNSMVSNQKNKKLYNQNNKKLDSDVSYSKSNNYYHNQIISLLEAEDRRDFNGVVKFYDLENLKRYWNSKYPSYDDLSKQYFKAWSTTSNSSNKINSIDKKWERIYDVNLDFRYFHKRKSEWKTVNSTVRFVFGQSDKIIEVYGLD